MLNSYAYLFALAISIFVFAYLYLLFYKKSSKRTSNTSKEKSKIKLLNVNARKDPAQFVANRLKSRAQNRMDYSDDSIIDKDTEITEQTGKKIGVKKARKIEEKKLKKEQREIEEREKEIRKKMELDLAAKEKIIKEEEEKFVMEMKAKLENEKNEKEKMEQALYEDMKINFEIEDEGINEAFTILEKERKLDEEILSYLVHKKIVMIEELSGYFNIKTQACVNKIKEYLKLEKVTGVIDDRGKFIHITPDEYAKVAKFILQRGRIHIKELVENSNKLIQLY